MTMGHGLRRTAFDRSSYAYISGQLGVASVYGNCRSCGRKMLMSIIANRSGYREDVGYGAWFTPQCI